MKDILVSALISVLGTLAIFGIIGFISFVRSQTGMPKIDECIPAPPISGERKSSVFKPDDCFYVKVSGEYLVRIEIPDILSIDPKSVKVDYNQILSKIHVFTSFVQNAKIFSISEYDHIKCYLPANHTLEQVK